MGIRQPIGNRQLNGAGCDVPDIKMEACCFLNATCKINKFSLIDFNLGWLWKDLPCLFVGSSKMYAILMKIGVTTFVRLSKISRC